MSKRESESVEGKPGFHYTAYGLKIASAIRIRELGEIAPCSSDVRIVIAELPDKLRGDVVEYGIWQATEGRFLLNVRDTARYLVADGKRIEIEPAAGSTEDRVNTHLIGSVMAALLQQRSVFCLHASAVVTRRGAVLFMGRSASGKSTLLAEFVRRGYTMLADDTSCLVQGRGGFYVVPAFPYVRLWRDVAEQLGLRHQASQQVRPELEKYLWPAGSFSPGRVPLYAINTLGVHNREHFELHECGSAERFDWLCRFTYRKNYLEGIGVRGAHFQFITGVAKSALMHRVVRPVAPLRVRELTDLLETGLELEPP